MGNEGIVFQCLSRRIRVILRCASASPNCGPGGENTYNTRGPLGPNFGDVSYQATIGNSVYNALEASLHHTSGRAEFFGSYTYRKSIDNGSNFGDQVDPFYPNLLRGLPSST